MNFWFFLWLLISVVLIGFSVWTTLILIRQKQAWRKFAANNKLRYRSRSLMVSPEIHGVYQGYPIGVFTSEHIIAEGRSERKMTAIEIEMESRMPVSGALGSKGMVPIIQTLEYSDTYQPNNAKWNVENLIRCDDKKVLEAYLTDARLEALNRVLERKNDWGLFIFKGNDTILRIDTPDPLEGAKDLQEIVDLLISVAKVLELNKGEDKTLLAYSTQRAATRNHRLDVEEETFTEKSAFELEDEDEVDGEAEAESKGEGDKE